MAVILKLVSESCEMLKLVQHDGCLLNNFFYMKTYTFKPDSKIRLDELLRRELPLVLGQNVSNSKIRRLIVAGAVQVNSRQVRVPGFTVFAKSTVTAVIEEEKLFFEKQVDDISFELTQKDVLFEDDCIIVVNKPSHFPTEKTIVDSRDNLHAAVVRYLFNKQKITSPNAKNPPYCGIIHRLDRDTSGVILFTKTREVNAFCHDMFEQHIAKKVYIAAVSKMPEQKKFTVDFTMGRISPKGQSAKWGRVAPEKGGLESRTDFEVSRIKSPFNLIECHLYTGRTHQIRVHLSSAGLSILGDELYGGKPFKRIMLHALSLTFPHPKTKEMICVKAPLPEEFYGREE